MKDELWSMSQRSRGLQGFRAELGSIWNDSAAQEINGRYLNPQQDDDGRMQQHLGAQENAIGQAQKQLAVAQDLAQQASKLSQQIAQLLEEATKEVTVAYNHYETYGRFNEIATQKFVQVFEQIQQASGACGSEPAFPGAEEASKAAAARLGGAIDYGKINSFGQTTGIHAKITKGMVGQNGIGSSAEQRIRPAGFVGGGRASAWGHARGHLLADQLGGSGQVEANLVTLYQNPVNTPYMRSIENRVRDAVDAGEVIDYKVTPIYSGNDPIPTRISIEATGDKGFSLKAIIENSPNAPPPRILK